MNVTINLFGQLRHLADADQVTLEAAEDGALLPTLQHLASQYPEQFTTILFDEDQQVRSSMMVLINDTAIDKANPPQLQDGDAITLLSAIAGG